MKTSRALLRLGFVVSFLLATWGVENAQAQTLLYRQVFAYGGSGLNTLAAQGIDWTDVYTTTGNSLAADNYSLRGNNSVGLATDVNFGAATGGSATTYYQQNYGYYGLMTTNTAGKYATSLYTTSLTLDPTANTYSFSWYQRNSTDISQAVHVLVQVGNVWYVSQASYTSLGAVTLENFTYNTTASNWLVLSSGAAPTNTGAVTASGAFNLSTAASTSLSGNVTAFGLFIDNPNDASTAYLSVDSFSVYSTTLAVPEPGTNALLLLGAAAGIVVVRRNRRVGQTG
ncbi:PEP-CTERM protein-sorting domain-containing protein [Verrucomicrobium sp. GAS474]|uniref:PEP-CTERM sorting domain-containing protein n=1 Tax=Verrucomicrobium sp. GAS474 TaxID=1882831 RepID=UPI00087ACF04|nr:PEP-CTERM sorting domain-containing protein [Verrucomicrobium sp. GAS474]SDT92757.1 PEP-CTERM protein-sorting domain-containing protein [Verrucomicrobium sp. GAS474]